MRRPTTAQSAAGASKPIAEGLAKEEEALSFLRPECAYCEHDQSSKTDDYNSHPVAHRARSRDEEAQLASNQIDAHLMLIF